MVNEAISKLVQYALQKGLIETCEKDWAVNTILDALKLDGYTDPGKDWGEVELAPVLERLLDDAYARGVLAENSVVYRDLFDTELLGRLTISAGTALPRTSSGRPPRSMAIWILPLTSPSRRRTRRPLPPHGTCPRPTTPAASSAPKTRATRAG